MFLLPRNAAPPHHCLTRFTIRFRELRPIDRALILLYLEERSYREIGEIIGISESNTGVRLQRIKRELAERLNQNQSL